MNWRMHYLPSRIEEFHRYFPEWADRKLRRGLPREAECNSYLAGGYAEEFGYYSQPGAPLALPQLKGDPEQSAYWRAQIGALHPGYPECPRPSDRFDPDHSEEQLIANNQARHFRSHVATGAETEFRVINVGLQRPPRDPSPVGWISRWKELRIWQRAFRDFL
jgi:hypothetical protein